MNRMERKRRVLPLDLKKRLEFFLAIVSAIKFAIKRVELRISKKSYIIYFSLSVYFFSFSSPSFSNSFKKASLFFVRL